MLGYLLQKKQFFFKNDSLRIEETAKTNNKKRQRNKQDNKQITSLREKHPNFFASNKNFFFRFSKMR